MALEKSWAAVRQGFTADGTSLGVVQVADATGYFNKMQVLLTSNTQENLSLEVKVVIGPNSVIVGPVGTGINKIQDVSAFRVADNAIISAAKQIIPAGPTPDEIIKAVYQRDPTVAIRTIMVDTFGDQYDSNNPLPVAFSASFPNVVKIADGGGSGNEVKVNADGSINVVTATGTGAVEVVNSVFNAITNVASNVSTLVATYTVPLIVTNSYLQRVEISGDNIATYDIQINGVVSARKRTYWGGGLNAVSSFITDEPSRGLILQPNDVVTVFVIHQRPYVGAFEARIQSLEVTG